MNDRVVNYFPGSVIIGFLVRFRSKMLLWLKNQSSQMFYQEYCQLQLEYQVMIEDLYKSNRNTSAFLHSQEGCCGWVKFACFKLLVKLLLLRNNLAFLLNFTVESIQSIKAMVIKRYQESIDFKYSFSCLQYHDKRTLLLKYSIVTGSKATIFEFLYNPNYCKQRMNMITNQTNGLKMPKIKPQLNIETSQNQFDLAFSPKQSSPPYNAYIDKHTNSYFNKKSVQKHLKSLAKAVEQQPKSQKNYKFIRSISQWIKPLAIKEELNADNLQQKMENKSNVSKSESKQTERIVKQKKSPYNVFPIFIKIQGEPKTKAKVSQSAYSLPQIQSTQPNVQQSPTMVSKQSKLNKKEKKKIDLLHSLKHKQFVQFLNKKKELLSNSFKLINKEMISLQNEK